MKKTIELSIIADAVEMASNDWQQFYNMKTGEVRSLPDGYSGYMDAKEFEREAEEIDESFAGYARRIESAISARQKALTM